MLSWVCRLPILSVVMHTADSAFLPFDNGEICGGHCGCGGRELFAFSY